MAFGLPFHTARFFRPTLLEVFGFTNTQLGDLFAVYGVTAMLCYFPGGAIVDRLSARFLLTASLLVTACGGLYMATIPGPFQMALLYGFWGITTIFLFWGALIRATREWGGESAQGAAFGILEGGRGVAAAVFAGLMVMVLAWHLPEDAALATDEERRAGFQMVILGDSAVAFAAGVLAWFVIPDPGEISAVRHNPFRNMALVIRRPIIWAQAAIIISLLGYTPEIFFAPIAGRILDANPGPGGFLNLFVLLAAIAALGVAFVVVLIRLKRNKLNYEPV
jgi:MFS family permease